MKKIQTESMPGAATGGTKTTLVDTSKIFEADLFNGSILKMIIGGKAYYRKITDCATSTLTFLTLPGTAASAVWTVATDITCTVTSVADGGNDVTIEAALAAEVSQDLSVAYGADDVIRVTLATNEAGASNDAANTLTLVTAAIDGLDGFSAVAAGEGSTVVAPTEEAIAFTGGVTEVKPVEGTLYEIVDRDADVKNTLTHTKATVGATTTAALAANADRKYALFINDSDATLYLKVGVAAVMNEGIRLIAGASYEMSYRIGNLDARAVNAISAAGNKLILVTEGV